MQTIEQENQNLLRNGYPPLADCETLHTPGPWAVETRKHVHAIKDSNGQDLAYQDTEPQIDAGSVTSRGRTKDETLANARLIAAAPDLLDALREMLSVFQEHEQYDEESAEVVSIARAAIAKAKGGEQC